ncbi:MAG: hypothetical protein ACOVP1_12265, partial [Bacteroidia bacterium]
MRKKFIVFFIIQILLGISLSFAQPCTSGGPSAPIPTKCFEIVSILVDACDGTNEGQNEMVRLRIGPNSIALNTITVPAYVSGNVNWGPGAPSNSFLGWSNITASLTNKVTTINNSIKAKGNCGLIIPIGAGGNIPARSNFLIITSTSFSATAQDFSNLQDTLYVAFQSSGNTAGHFANYGTPSDTRRLILRSGSCYD